MSVTLGRARDRDLDRVQRAALRALPPGARGRPSTRARRSAHLPARPAPRCSPPGSTAIAGFAVLVALGHPHAARLRLRHRGRPRPSRCWACWSRCPPCSCSPSAASCSRCRAEAWRALRRALAARASARARSGALGMTDDGPLASTTTRRARASRGPTRRRRAAAGADVPRRRAPTRALRVALRGRRAARDRLRHAQHAAHPGRAEAPAGGKQLPPFAAPLALSSLDGDANVARRAGSGAAGTDRRVRCGAPTILNVCDLARRGPLVLAFLTTRGGAECDRQLDVHAARSAALPGGARRGDGDPRRPRRPAHAHPRRGWRSRSATTATAPSPASTASRSAHDRLRLSRRLTMVTDSRLSRRGQAGGAGARAGGGVRARGWKPPR